MKIKKLLLLNIFLSSILFISTAFAKQSLNINESFAFNPVNWTLDQSSGGFSINNTTSKNQYVQIVVNSGVIDVFKLVGNTMSCESSLNGNSAFNSTICELAPGEKMQVDLDFVSVRASGTLQIEMGQ